MKWIGQHVWDYISRFRNDVYLEDISTGTIASGGNLGLDSNNKIVKATISSGSGDIESVTAGVGLSGGGTTGAVTLTVDFSEFSDVTPVNGDSLATLDSDGSTEQLTTVADLATLFAGTGLTASNSVIGVDASQTQITSVGTIGTGVWQGTAIASAYLDSDTAHYSAQKQLTYYMFRADIDTTKTYVGLQEADGESSTSTNKNLPILAPVAGKLLKVFLRATTDVSGNTFTWRLETQNTSSNTGAAPSVIGTQSGAGCGRKTMATYDFTTSLDSGTNVIGAGDTVQLSIESDSATANTTYYITCLWEWDLS